MKYIKAFESFVTEGRKQFQDTPNEFAYLDLKNGLTRIEVILRKD